MRKFFGVAAVVVIVLTMGVSTASSALPSAKATANVSDITILDYTGEQEWTTILQNTLKTPNQKDLFIDVSLECGLYTRTLVKSSGSRDTSVAEAGVYVQVLVDEGTTNERVAYPGEVVFCRRTQTLSALFGGLLQCTDANGDGIITDDECAWTDEELELILDTMNANAFNYVLDDLGPGEHTVKVQARISSEAEAGAGVADAKATIGKGSMTVEEVRLIKGEDVVIELE